MKLAGHTIVRYYKGIGSALLQRAMFYNMFK